MGVGEKTPLKTLNFDSKVRLEFRHVLLSPQTLELLACRELDDAWCWDCQPTHPLNTGKEGRTCRIVSKGILHGELIPLLRQSGIYSPSQDTRTPMMPIDFPKTQP